MSKEANAYEGEVVVPQLESENDEKPCHKRNQGRERVSLQRWELRKEDAPAFRCTDSRNEFENALKEVENEEAEAELHSRLAKKHTNWVGLSPFTGYLKWVVCPKIPPNPTNTKKDIGQVVQVSDEGGPVVGDRIYVTVRTLRPFLI